MRTVAGIPDTQHPTEHDDLYNRDHYTWARQQADALRRRDFDAVDWENITEEIEALVRGEESALKNQYARIMEHFLKIQYWEASDTDPVARWQISIDNARIEINTLLEDNPGLKPGAEDLFQKAWTTAKLKAVAALVNSGTARITDPAILSRERKRLRREWAQVLPSRNPYTLLHAQDLNWGPQPVRVPNRPASHHHAASRPEWTR